MIIRHTFFHVNWSFHTQLRWNIRTSADYWTLQTKLFLWRCSMTEYDFSLQITNYFHIFSWDLFGSHISKKYSNAKITTASAQLQWFNPSQHQSITQLLQTLFETFLTTHLGKNAAPSFHNFKMDHYTTPNSFKFSIWDNFVEIIGGFCYYWYNSGFIF